MLIFKPLHYALNSSQSNLNTQTFTNYILIGTKLMQIKFMEFIQRVKFSRPYPENFVLRYFSEQYLIFALNVLYLFHLTQLQNSQVHKGSGKG